MIPIINFNGDIVPKDFPVFNFEHSAIFKGEIIQENIRLLSGDLLYPEKHYFHLMAMMRMARMDIPMSFTPDFFYKQIQRLIDHQSLKNAKISFNICPKNTETDFWITAKVLPQDLIYHLPYEIDQFKETHVSNAFFERIQFLSPHNRIFEIFAFENDLQDLVLTNHNKNVARAVHGNFFLLKDETLSTPRLEDGAKDQTYRDMTIQAAKRVPNIAEIKEEEIFPFALMKADEVFVVKDGEGFFPVTQFRKKTFACSILPDIVSYFEELG